MKQPVRIISTLDACTEACDLLKRAGFEIVAVSRQSVATYFRFPGRSGVLRVADHPGGKPLAGLDPVLAKLTFLPHKLRKEPDTLAITEHSLHSLVCAAIGRYMIASNQEVRSTYDGPKLQDTTPYRSFHVAWSDGDRQHVGLCEQFPSLSHLADTDGEALAGIMRLVAEADIDEIGRR